MQRFHRAFTLTLLVLALPILSVEFFRVAGPYPRVILIGAFTVFCIKAFPATPPPGTKLRSANSIDYAVSFPSFEVAPLLPLKGWCMLCVVLPATSCDLRIR